MLIVHVHIHVKPEFVDLFRAASFENAQNSIKEAGISRFDLLQNQDDPTYFLLVEVYKSKEAAALHKETAHYQKWRDAVVAMMAEPRKSDKFTLVFPED